MARTPAFRRVWIVLAASVAVLPVLLQPLPAAASSTGTLFGIDIRRSAVVSIDPTTGATNPVADLSLANQPLPGFLDQMASDPATHRLFLIRIVSDFSNGFPTTTYQLMTVDTQGKGVLTVSPGLAHPVTSLAFDTSTGTVLGFTGDCCPNQIVSIDPTSGALSHIADVIGNSFSFMAFSPTTHSVYLDSESFAAPPPSPPTNTLLIVDTTQTDHVTIGPALSPGVNSLAFDTSLGALFGTTFFPPHFVQVNTTTGAETTLGSYDFGFFLEPGTTIDPATHTFFKIQDVTDPLHPEVGPVAHIVSINDQTGAGTLGGTTGTNLAAIAFESPGIAPIDTSPPVTSAALSPAPNAAGLNNTDVTVNLSATDPDGVADVATIQYSATGAQNIAPTVVPGSTASFTVGAEGVTTITYFATDSAGNTEAAHTQVIRIDKTPPVTSIALSPAPNAAGWNNADVTVNLSATDSDGVADVATIQYSATGAQPIAPTIVAGSTASFSVTAEGVTTVSYFAQDKAGNTEAAHSQVIRIDKTPPTVTYTGNAGAYTVDQTVAITCTAADPPNANGTPGSGLASTTCASVNAPAYTFPLGPNTISATATDVAGNVGSGSTTFTVQVTSSSLCSLTARFIQSSPASQTSPALAQAQADRLCKLLSTAQLASGPAKKALVAAYQQGLTLLVSMGLLTPAQAAILLTLSQAL